MNTSSPRVLFEDHDFAIIDKPAGIVVNRADTTKNIQTLQDWIGHTIELAPAARETDFVMRSGIVHRLDKDTSGLLIVAKNEGSFTNIQKQFKEKVVKKTYLALAHGRVVPDEGEVNVPVGRLPWDRKKFGVVVEGRQSRTVYKVVEYLELAEGKKKYDYTLLEAYPHTGRTHQIRVHLRYLGFPIAGDLLYGGRKNIQLDKKYLNRHFLHAAKICFVHPTTGEKVLFDSPLPRELKSFLGLLRRI